MLKTNSKAVKEAVRAYLIENVSEMMQERDIVTDKPFHAYLDIINHEKFYQDYKCNFDMFVDWLQGLGGFGADIYYHGSKRGFLGGLCQDILQDWLMQTDEEVKKYSGTQSENLMVMLCWREFEYLMKKEGGARNV